MPGGDDAARAKVRPDARASSLIRVRREEAWAMIWIETALRTDETAYDSFTSAFAAMIAHASSAMAITDILTKEDAGFTFETEYLAPIYWVAIKCRHPLLRRAALRLLGKAEVMRRQENLWLARELAVIGKHIIESEEGQDEGEIFRDLDA